ncbi:TetR-family transcriptional regulator [[Actinomadura] parvosata subsp. kistnae]|uniref:TetR family transcriptional regulator n=1 Tax=[Actinomadura] parvosata subsp. kistnae TaxID=1909395 RepID=A0A1U9ZZX2_9ACTN|nr:TetR family transcriptional regulator [Nonomuraea sp. ATCC 55076]AQZ63501.1 TetR family transcriptional regulator [Nonomuraea sp. ATCC 55076]SPL99242.1 TetR-family transcriptional regulator [Actinomadura parvosata subsp. kistnae]
MKKDVVTKPRRERADASRNRAKILAAAAGIVAARGVEALSMAEVAAAAGVGVGTLYRRFGDRSGLAYALIDERERQFQQAFLEGPAPLGPGAPAPARVRAFLHALVDRTMDQLDLLVMAETASPFARFGGAYELYHRHLAMLLAHLRPAHDTPFLADALLAPLAAPLLAHRLRGGALTPERVKAGLDDLLAGLGTAGEGRPAQG